MQPENRGTAPAILYGTLRIAARSAVGAVAVIPTDHYVSARPANLATLPVRGVRWSDWGRPRRVLATLEEIGIEPDWMKRAASVIA